MEKLSRLDARRHKGIPLGTSPEIERIVEARWSIANGDTSTPIATLSHSALHSNIVAMQEWCDRHGVSLAPHAKTALSAELVGLQLEYGAWGLTAALPRQVALLWEFGATKVLLANEVTDPAAIRWLSSSLAEDSRRRLLLYADSLDSVTLVSEALRDLTDPQPLEILVELGYSGGRTGARSIADAIGVAEAVIRSPYLRLAGVAGYEGTISADRLPDALHEVDQFLDDLATLAIALAGRFEVTEPIVSAGGSLYFDRVVRAFDRLGPSIGARVVLRSGCYLIHDHGLYARGTPSNQGVADAPILTPALSVWTRIVSMPESGLALLDAGRRDVSHDAGLPTPLERVRNGQRLGLSGAGVSVSGLSDQHAFLRYPLGLDFELGDMIRLGISHPCTTLDHWRALLVINDDDEVIAAITTEF